MLTEIVDRINMRDMGENLKSKVKLVMQIENNEDPLPKRTRR